MRARYVAVLGLMVLVATPLMAQPPQNRPGQPGQEGQERRQAMARVQMPRGQAGPGPEMILRLREQLNLTEAQVNRLDALRQEGVNARRERMAEMLDLRSQVQAGQMTREQLQERMRTRADAAPAGAPDPGERVRAVLNDQQRMRLAELQVDQMRRQMQMQQHGRQMPRSGVGRGAGPGQRPMLRGMRRVPPGQAPGLDRMRQRVMERRVPLRRGPGGAAGPEGAIDP